MRNMSITAAFAAFVPTFTAALAGGGQPAEPPAAQPSGTPEVGTPSTPTPITIPNSGKLSFDPEQASIPEQPVPAKTAPGEDAPGEGGDNARLAKMLSNPVANLMSFPFQFNWDTGFGPNDTDRWLLNIQPVIPFTLTEDWNLITRTILPVIDMEALADGLDSSSGIGDITQSFFFSPKDPVDGWILGFGPAFNWPTSTDGLGNRNYGVGPTFVALRQEHGFTYGLLCNHIWSFAGPDGEPEINSTFLQPFVSYTFPTATSITLNTESTYDWSGSQWTVPINLFAGQILRLGKLPVQVFAGGRWYAEAPEDGPEWGVRFGFTILLPR